MFVAWQRSVTSAHRLHATRRVQSAVWTDRAPSHVSVNPAGRGRAARTVSSDTSFGILYIFIQLLNRHTFLCFLSNILYQYFVLKIKLKTDELLK